MFFREKWVNDIKNKWLQLEGREYTYYLYIGNFSLGYLQGFFAKIAKGRPITYSALKVSREHPVDFNQLCHFKRVTDRENLRKLEKILTKALLKTDSEIKHEHLFDWGAVNGSI
jgi:hypothetical protein